MTPAGAQPPRRASASSCAGLLSHGTHPSVVWQHRLVERDLEPCLRVPGPVLSLTSCWLLGLRRPV